MYFGEGFYTLPSNYNLRKAFHEENVSMTDFTKIKSPLWRIEAAFSTEFYHVSKMLKLMEDRFLYIAGLSKNLKYFRETGGVFEWEQYLNDRLLVEKLVERINTVNDPIFAFVHLIGTHGPRFDPGLQRYSKGLSQDKDWHTDFYDDAIFTQDSYMAKVLNALVESGKFDNTLFIYKTDHGLNNIITEPVPLIVRFPGQRDRIEVDTVVQYMDIAPSVLKYLGLEIPVWMKGKPIFSRDPFNGERKEPIYAVYGYFPKEGNVTTSSNALGPPHYAIEALMAKKGEYSLWFDIKKQSAQLYGEEGDKLRPVMGNPSLMLPFVEKTISYLETNSIKVSK
jgi:hypothetical protein